MNEIECGKCEVCGKDEPLIRSYFRYPEIKCECHGPGHFEWIRHGVNCVPKEPLETTIRVKTEDLKNPLPMAMKILINNLKEDKGPDSYYYSWQSNIACAIIDTMPESDSKHIHALANEAVKKFLDNLIL